MYFYSMKTFTLLIILLFYASEMLGQGGTLAQSDSLTKLLNQVKLDTARADILFQLAQIWQAKDFNKSIDYGKEALAIAKKLNDAKRTKDCLFSLAFTYQMAGDTPQSIEMLQKILPNVEKNDPNTYALALAFIGMNYKTQGDYQNALYYQQRSFRMHEERVKANKKRDLRGDLGGGQASAEIFEKLNQLDSALLYAKLSYHRLEKSPVLKGGESFEWNIPWIYGKIEGRLNHPQKALTLLREALQNAIKYNDDVGVQTVQFSVAEVFSRISQPDSAIIYAIDALENAKKTKNYQTVADASFLLKLLYEKQNNFTKALNYFEVGQVAKDSLTNIEKIKQVQLLTFKEDRRQQELENAQLAYQNQVKQYALMVGLIVILVIATILYRNNRQKHHVNKLLYKQKEEIETLNRDLENKVVLRTAELKNALEEVRTAFGKGQTTERKRVSADLHDEIGSALSTIAIFSDLTKQKAQKIAPDLVSELDRIGTKSRDMIQIMRNTVWVLNEENPQNLWERMYQYGNETLSAKGIVFNWQIDNEQISNVSFEVKRNLFLAFKEAINNIVKHAEATEVKVVYDIKRDGFELIICDNGKGFDAEKVQNQGNGLRNFDTRMKEIGGLATIKSSVNNGTTLIFKINFDSTATT